VSALESAFRARFGRAPLRHEVEEVVSRVAMSWADLGWLTRMWREDLAIFGRHPATVRALHRSLQMLRIAKHLKEQTT
jgi:hypothetical protein